MTTKLVTRFAVMLTVAIVAAVIPVSAKAAAPMVREDDDKVVLENDFVRVWFQGKKPMLKVMPVGNDSESASFSYKFADLVEYRDVDADGAPSRNEVLASLNLEKASTWKVTTSEESGVVELNLSLEAPVQLGQREITENVTVMDRNASIAILFTIRGTAATISAAGENVTIPATSVKYDLVVERWPFVNAQLDRLALGTKVTGALSYDNETQSANVLANGTAIGAISWTTNATGVSTDGENVTIPVRAAIAQDLDNETSITYTYDAPDLASLVHDPTVGTMATSPALEENADDGAGSGVPAPGVALLAVAVGAVALIVGRRPR